MRKAIVAAETQHKFQDMFPVTETMCPRGLKNNIAYSAFNSTVKRWRNLLLIMHPEIENAFISNLRSMSKSTFKFENGYSSLHFEIEMPLCTHFKMY